MWLCQALSHDIYIYVISSPISSLLVKASKAGTMPLRPVEYYSLSYVKRTWTMAVQEFTGTVPVQIRASENHRKTVATAAHT